MHTDSVLGYALLGLLYRQPQSGYDLRKIFAATAMGSYSDSPGAIYPALERLARQGKVRGVVEKSAGLRRRRVYQVTQRGRAALKAWLKAPITRDDVMRRMGDLMLRFACMGVVMGPEQTARFLRELEREIAAYVPELRQFLQAHTSKMPLSGRLALEFGIGEYEHRLQWARSSAALYEQRKGNRR